MIVNNPRDIFSKINLSALNELIDIAAKFESIDRQLLVDDFKSKFSELDKVRSQWVESLDSGNPDFSLYGHQLYLNETFDCWRTYSRKYLKMIEKIAVDNNSIINPSDVTGILDLGCGCAYSTIGLSAIFPDANVYATNLKGTLQYDIDEYVTDNFDNIVIKDESDTFNFSGVDLIFASEFFEHQLRPVEMLRELINTYRPKYFVFANTFTQMALGHFRTYFDMEYAYEGRKISKVFNKTLRDYGYKKADTGFFNGRPNVYVRDDNNLEYALSMFND
jgi:hypothetical protein